MSPPVLGYRIQRWGILDKGADRSEVLDLGIGIEKVVAVDRSIAASIEGYCYQRPIDMIVMATAGRNGILSWLKPSRAEEAAKRAANISIPTLFVPADCRGCVSLDTGEVVMDQVLVSVDHHPDSNSAVERGLRAISKFGGEQSDLQLLHVGSEASFPDVQIPDGPWKVSRVARKGDPAAEIIAVANEIRANLIVMVTKGTGGLLDVLRGTTTEQVLRQAPCPVLAVPATT